MLTYSVIKSSLVQLEETGFKCPPPEHEDSEKKIAFSRLN
jgi:hypothetical protein